jgi:hypothetical protein
VKSNPHAGPPGGRGRSEPAPSGDGDRAQLIQVATRCATLDEFVERFAAFAWEGSLVLPAATALPVGTQGKFVVLLRDKTVAMRGRCRVTEAKQTPATRNPAVKRIMMRVALLEMDEASRAVHRRLIALRSAPVPLPVPPEASETTAIEPARQGGPAGQGGSAREGGSARAPEPAPVSVAPAPPAKAPPAAPPVNINRTMIGIGIGPDGRAFLSKPAAAPAPAPVPPEISEPTVVNEPTGTRSRIPTLPRNETRAPGASYTLPANPLSEFGAEDVESFIECTLLEADADTGTGIAEPPPQADLAGSGPTRQTAHVRARALIAKLPPSLQGRALRVAPYALVAVISIVVGYGMRGSPPAPPAVAKPAPAAPAPAARMAARAPEPEIQQLEAIEAPVRKTSPEKPKPAAAPKPAAVARPTPPDKAVEVAKPTAPEKTVAAEKPAAPEKAVEAEKPAVPDKPVAVEKPTPPQKVALAEKPAAPQKPAAVEKVAAPAKAVAVEKPVPDEKPAPAAAAPAAASGEPGACTARVVTEPKDAKVIWNDQVIGRSPIEGARVPCGAARVTIDRERWQTVTLDVNAQAGNAAVVHERLRRPRGTLIISSSPPGAQITVNRIAAGTAPKEVDVQRFEKVPVKVTLKGHQPWTKTIYLKESEMKLDAQLVPRK